MQLEMREKPHERDCVLEARRGARGLHSVLVSNLRVSNSKAIEESELVRITAVELRFSGFVRYEILRRWPETGRTSSFEIFARDNSRIRARNRKE